MSEEEKHKNAEDLTASGADRSATPNARGPSEEDLPPSLKAIEAELAALTPRTDRLDRERVIFLAGQQSVVGCVGRKGTVPFSLRENRDSPLRENRDSPLRENRDSPLRENRDSPLRENRDSARARWGWPAAFSAMTAVAVTLLLMLLLQPQAPGEVRFVEVPVQPSGNDGVEPDADFPSSPSDGQHVEPTPG
ncbi:unnamed protein product, partial [marine sediment metagenome]